MKTEMALDELLKSVRSILAKALDDKPMRRGKAVADPVLWRAIQNQEKSRGSVPLLVVDTAESPPDGRRR
jgi:hypothetical protein